MIPANVVLVACLLSVMAGAQVGWLARAVSEALR